MPSSLNRSRGSVVHCSAGRYDGRLLQLCLADLTSVARKIALGPTISLRDENEFFLSPPNGATICVLEWEDIYLAEHTQQRLGHGKKFHLRPAFRLCPCKHPFTRC